jgi:nicotinate-nucleotide pyrophosphorylase (carboxylating)
MHMDPPIPVPGDLPAQVARALAEDVGSGDLTAALVPAGRSGRASVITREPAILCGMPYVNASFAGIDPAVRVEWWTAEGASVAAGQLLFTVEGPARALLTAERTALNFLQFLSATATAAHAYAVLIEGTACRVLDTRKTIPGLRSAQKYAVRVGGGQNHRIGLFDGILIKENHIHAAGGLTQAIRAALHDIGEGVMLQVEVETLDQLREAIGAGAKLILIDNFDLPQMREAVKIAGDKAELEASGGVNLQSVRAIAETGVHRISIGSITKDIEALDLSMRFIHEVGHSRASGNPAKES